MRVILLALAGIAAFALSQAAAAQESVRNSPTSQLFVAISEGVNFSSQVVGLDVSKSPDEGKPWTPDRSQNRPLGPFGRCFHNHRAAEAAGIDLGLCSANRGGFYFRGASPGAATWLSRATLSHPPWPLLSR